MFRKCAWLLASSLLAGQPALAAGPGVADLFEAGAHRQAALAIARELPGLRGAERDRAWHRLGQARRLLGDLGGAEAALAEIRPGSAWYPRAIADLADLFSLDGKRERAIEAFRSLIAALPEREALPVRLRLGEELAAGGDLEGAIAAFRPLHDCKDPPLREASWYGAGWAATRSGQHARAAWFWQQAIREFPASPRIKEARLNLANHYLRMGRLAFAAEQLRAAGEDPGLRDADSVILTAEFVAAEAAVDAKDWVRAIQAYKRAAASERWAEPAAYGIGHALWLAGKLSEAEEALERVLETHPRGRFRPAARYTLGRVQEDRGKAGEARETYRAVLAEGKSRWAEEALFQLAGLELSAGKPSLALTWCQRLMADYPGGRMALPGLWLLAESQLASGAISDAIDSYSSLARRPESLSFLEGKGSSVMFKLGMAYFKSGDLTSADAAFKEVRADAGSLVPDAAFWRGEALYRLGRFAEAAAAFDSVVSRHPDAPKAPEAAYGLGWSELRRGRKGPATTAFRSAARGLLDRDRKRDAYHRLAMLQLDEGAYKDAQESLRRVIELDAGADPTEGAFYLAWSQMKAGDLEEAVQGFAGIADRQPATLRGRQARSFQGQSLLRLARHAEAAKAFETLIGLPPAPAGLADVDPRIRAAAAYLSAGDGARAAGWYAQVAEDASASSAVRRSVWLPLTGAYLQAGLLARAEGVLTGVASGDAWVPGMLVKVADAYGKAGKWREAAAAYAAVPAADFRVRLEQARALRRGGAPDAAAEVYQQLAAEVRPGSPVKLAVVLFELLEAYEEAERQDLVSGVLDRLERAPGVDSERLAQAWLRFGETALKKGDPVLAELAFRSAAKRATKGTVFAWKVRYSVGNALVACGRFEDALFELTTLTSAKEPAGAKEPATAFRAWKALAWLKQGEALEKLRRWEEARNVYTAVSNDGTIPERERQEAEARLAWIKAHVRRGQP